MISGVGFSASLDSRCGRLSSAEADLNVLVELTEQNDLSLMALATMLHFSVDAIVERPGLRNVADLIETLKLPPPFARTQSGGMALEARAAIRTMVGNRAGAVADLRATGEIFDALRASPRFTSWRSRLALPCRTPTARRPLCWRPRSASSLAASIRRGLGIAQRAVGLLARGEEGIDELRDSVATLRNSPAPLELARSLAEVARRCEGATAAGRRASTCARRLISRSAATPNGSSSGSRTSCG